MFCACEIENLSNISQSSCSVSVCILPVCRNGCPKRRDSELDDEYEYEFRGQRSIHRRTTNILVPFVRDASDVYELHWLDTVQHWASLLWIGHHSRLAREIEGNHFAMTVSPELNRTFHHLDREVVEKIKMLTVFSLSFELFKRLLKIKTGSYRDEQTVTCQIYFSHSDKAYSDS